MAFLSNVQLVEPYKEELRNWIKYVITGNLPDGTQGYDYMHPIVRQSIVFHAGTDADNAEKYVRINMRAWADVDKRWTLQPTVNGAIKFFDYIPGFTRLTAQTPHVWNWVSIISLMAKLVDMPVMDIFPLFVARLLAEQATAVNGALLSTHGGRGILQLAMDPGNFELFAEVLDDNEDPVWVNQRGISVNAAAVENFIKLTL